LGAHQSKVGLAAAAVAAALAILAAPAHAAFPGQAGKIAFHTNRDGNFEIYSMTPAGGSPTRLTNNGANDVTPAWSPDGTQLVWVSDRDGNYEVYRMNADGTGQTRMTTNAASDVAPSWSADGTKIVFASTRDGNSEIYTMNSTNGTSVTRLTNNAAIDSQAAWSPQDDKIAFTTDREGPLQIYTMNTNGTGQTRFAPAEFTASQDANWSADGERMAWSGQRTGDTTLDIYTGTSSGWSSHLGSSSGIDGDPAWSPACGSGNCGIGSMFVYHTNAGGDYDILKDDFTNITNNAIEDQSPDWQPVTKNYARPQGATPVQLALVPAFKQCTTTNAKHKGALATKSCNPAIPESNYLTMGSPDFNGQAANAAGLIQMRSFCNGGASGETPPCLTTPGDQLDGQITINQTDVRCIGTSGSCPNGALSDYAGNLLLKLTARVTDRNSGGLGGATLLDVPVSTTFSCITNGLSTIGSTCSATTSFDALLGGASIITEQKRAVWELRNVEIYDGGTDGVASTQGDNTLFEVGGLFFP
jgi:hypothetical protein